jgi:hypothetical protein
VNVNTDLQITVVKIFLKKVYPICSLYLPHSPIKKETFTNLIAQLSTPFLILGDMNAKSLIWGNDATDERGRMFEELLLDCSISVLNDYSPTHFHIQTGSHSSIDLSICSSDCVLDFEFTVLEDLYDSDHFPIFLKVGRQFKMFEQPERFKIKDADWELFYELTNMDQPNQIQDINQQLAILEECIIDAAMLSIPLKGGLYKKPPVPWFDD